MKNEDEETNENRKSRDWWKGYYEGVETGKVLGRAEMQIERADRILAAPRKSENGCCALGCDNPEVHAAVYGAPGEFAASDSRDPWNLG